MAQVVAVLDKGVVDPDAPLLAADDLGVVRGDGVFETISYRGGDLFQLEPHLARMVRSADRLDFTLPSLDRIRALAWDAAKAYGTEGEAAVRLVATRGPEGGGEPTVYATVNPIAASVIDARNNGIDLISLNLGYPIDTRAKSPWLLGGAKSLSYAVTMAAQRYAVGAGYHDALWVSDDGWALEGPTSTLVWLVGDTLCTVGADTGILIGTTAAYVLERAGELGLRAVERRIRPGELAEVEGVWMASSTRGLAPVLTLDGVAMPSGPRGRAVRELAGYPLR